MASFTKGPNLRTPFGRRHFLGSTQDVKVESYTLCAAVWPSESIDGSSQKVAQPGTVLALITSGENAGMVGPFQAGGPGNEIVEIEVKADGGTFTLTLNGATTGAIPYDASAADVKAAILDAVDGIGVNDLIVTGGPGDEDGENPYVIEFTGDWGLQNVGAITTDASSLTLGGSAGSATVTTTQGSAADSGGADDGRSNPENIVGILNTFLPWQLLERNVEVGVVYEATVVRELCLELNAAGTKFVPLSQATADAMAVTRRTRFTYRKRSSEI